MAAVGAKLGLPHLAASSFGHSRCLHLMPLLGFVFDRSLVRHYVRFRWFNSLTVRNVLAPLRVSDLGLLIPGF